MRVRIIADTGRQQTWEIDDQDNLFVEVIRDDAPPQYVGSLWFDEHGNGSWDVFWGTSLNEQEWWEQTNPVRYTPPEFERVPKTTILIHAWDGGSSGFDWEPVSNLTACARLCDAYEADVESGLYSHVALTEIRVAGYSIDSADRDSISEFIEGELQDAITLGRVGHIVARHSLEGA